MRDIDPPIDAEFEGDRARYMRHYFRENREDVLAAVRDHREVRGDA